MNRTAFLLSLLVAGGCAATASDRAPADSVVVYNSVADIGAEYEVIAPIRPTQRRYGRTADVTVEDARRQAAGMGANGLLLLSADDAVSDARIRQAISANESYSRTTMVAILVEDSKANSQP